MMGLQLTCAAWGQTDCAVQSLGPAATVFLSNDELGSVEQTEADGADNNSPTDC